MTVSLVTGAAGFIGSHVVDELINMGHDVVALDDLSGGFEENVNSEARFIKGSILDYELITNLFLEYKFEYVYHLAAYAAEGLSHFIKRFNYSNNLIGSVNLINASIITASVRCFIFTSSIAVYGSNQLPMTEDMPPQPEDPYGIAKNAVERDLLNSHQVFGHVGDNFRNVIGIFIRQAIRGEPFTIFGDGNQTRAFSHIDDVAPIIARSVDRTEAYNQVFNIGADQPYSINDLARRVAEIMGIELKVKYLPARHEVVNAYSSHVKAHLVFGDLFSNIPLDAGLRRMIDWVEVNGIRKTRIFSDIEIMKNLPSSWLDILREQE
jgi:UDP-glucose 4-epimerase